MTRKDNPDQRTSTVFCPPVVVPHGDGSLTVKPGRPVTRLTALQLASHFGVDRDTIYRWRQEGIIPEDMVSFAGKRKLLFAAEVVAHLEQSFQRQRE